MNVSSPVKPKNRKPTKATVLRRLLGNPLGAFSLVVLAVFCTWALFPSLLSPYDPNISDFLAMKQGPSWLHLLGTDDIGRDNLSRVIWASRNSLAPVVVSFTVTLVFGTLLGLLAGYVGGPWRWLGNWFTSIVMTLPVMVVLLAAIAIVGPNMYSLMAVFGFLLVPMVYRLVSQMTIAAKQELYVDAARVFGLSDTRILIKHILPVVRGPVLIQAGFLASIGIVMQAGLQFLGVGDTKEASFGGLINAAYINLVIDPAAIVFPVVVMGVLTAALVLLSTALSDAIEKKNEAAGKVSKTTKPKTLTDAGAGLAHADSLESTDALLRLDKLAIGYGQPDGSMKVVVSDSTLSIKPGEVVGLVGESGSGKTQTALAVLGLLSPGGQILSGQVEFHGVKLSSLDVKSLTALRGTSIAYIPQEPMSGLDPSFTIGSQLIEPMIVKLGLKRSQAKSRALELLAKVGMPDPQKTYKSYPHEVSGGQAQRVLIAAALSLSPKLIIADEPTTALDVTIQAEVLELLRNLQQETKVAILLVTHNFGVVADLCSRVVIMQNGQVVESGATREIFSHARHPYTKSLLAAIIDDSLPARAAYELDRDPETAPIVAIQNLEVTYKGKRGPKSGFRALKGVDIQIRPGETVGLVGESGSGKTTLGRALLGLAPISGGSIKFEGSEISSAGRSVRRALSASLQVVFQDPYSSLNPKMKIGEILAEPLRAQGVSQKQALEKVRELLKAVALPEDSLTRFASEFSGGQRQRIAIARALALEPKLIVCDEPVSALDLSTSAQVLELFKEIQERTGVAYLFISHDLSVVRHLSHRIAVMRNGEIVEWGNGDQVTSNPSHPYTRKLLLAAPVADPEIQMNRRVERLRLENSSGQEVQ